MSQPPTTVSLKDAIAPAALPLAPTPPKEISPEALAKEQRFAVRVWSTFTFVICAGMLGFGIYLTPNPTGVETHRQLGLPPCGFYYATGLPCPTCGCTTSVTYFVHGHPLTSLFTQPFGFAVALVAMLLLPLSVMGAISGRWLGPSQYTMTYHWRWLTFGGLGILAAGWVYKIIMVKAGFPIH